MVSVFPGPCETELTMHILSDLSIPPLKHVSSIQPIHDEQPGKHLDL